MIIFLKPSEILRLREKGGAGGHSFKVWPVVRVERKYYDKFYAAWQEALPVDTEDEWRIRSIGQCLWRQKRKNEIGRKSHKIPRWQIYLWGFIVLLLLALEARGDEPKPSPDSIPTVEEVIAAYVETMPNLVTQRSRLTSIQWQDGGSNITDGFFAYPFTINCGTNLTCTSASSVVTMDASGGGGGAPTTAEYLVLTLDGTLSAERTFTAGVGIGSTDGGANGAFDIFIDNSELTANQTFWTGASASRTITFSLLAGSPVLTLSENVFNISSGELQASEAHIIHTAVAADEHALEIDTDAAGFGDVKALDIFYDTGAISAGEDEGVILINIDESDSTGGDVVGLEILSTTGSATVYGVELGVGINPVLQLSGAFGNMDSALVLAVDSLTAFTTSDPGGANNVDMFVADDDTITIGDAAKYQEMEFLLEVVSSVSIQPTFEYSTGVGTWAAFTPVDGTNGMRNSGIVAWLVGDIPGWVVGTGSEFLIRITRTRNSVNTVPTEDLVQIVLGIEYMWDSSGNLNLLSVQSGSGAEIADAGFIRCANAEVCVAWEADPAGTDITLTVDSSERLTSSAPINATTGFQIGGAAASTEYLRGNGTNFVSAAIVAGDLPSHDVVCATDPCVQPAEGGTGDDTSGTTGIARIDSGNWTYAELSGDVATSGSNATLIQAGVVASAELATANKTFTKSIVLIDPTTTEDDMIQWMHGSAVTYTQIDCSTDVATSTVTIDMDHRVLTTPNTVGTDIITSTVVCDTDNQQTTSFADATIPANVPVNLSITATANSPTVARIHITYTKD